MIPWFGYLGILTLFCLLFTASIPTYFVKKGKISMKVHFVMAKITVVLALIHGTIAVLKYT